MHFRVIFTVFLLIVNHSKCQTPEEINTTISIVPWVMAPWSDESRDLVVGLAPAVSLFILIAIIGTLQFLKEKRRRMEVQM